MKVGYARLKRSRPAAVGYNVIHLQYVFLPGDNLLLNLLKDLSRLEKPKTNTNTKTKSAASVGEEGGEAEVDELGLAHLLAVLKPTLEHDQLG